MLLSTFGVVVDLDVADDLWPSLVAHLPRSTVVQDGQPEATFGLRESRPGLWTLSRGVGTILDGAELAHASVFLASNVALTSARATDDVTVVHAAVAADGGGGVVLPGVSGAGKTTLVTELLARGMTYFSDEYAVLDDHGCVLAYPRPLVARAACLPARERDALVTLLFTRYLPGGEWSPTRLSPGEAAVHLLEHTISPRTERTLNRLSTVCESAECWSAVRGEAAVVAGPIMALHHGSTGGRLR